MIVSRIHSTKKLLSVFVIVTFRLFEAGRAFVLDRSRLLSSARPMRSFDFASPSGWDDFYKHKQSGTDTPVGSSVSTTTTTTTRTTRARTRTRTSSDRITPTDDADRDNAVTRSRDASTATTSRQCVVFALP
mmetsp:Transcript_22604/g.50537  ORF Transcript_22604/g.50537 Transcript_22604/m.50537 type:complete len:132 (-) Transcript_22604:53-448(-)